MAASTLVLHSLADLKAARVSLAKAAQVANLARIAQRKATQLDNADHSLFLRAVGAVEPLPLRHKSRRTPTPEQLALPEPRQRLADEAQVLIDAISDEFDASTLLEVDDLLSFRRPGIGQDVLRRLRRGEWSIQNQLDLHGLRREEAREQLTHFVRVCHRRGVRCVRVVHGKGLGSPGKMPVLKSKVHSWLVQKAQVLAFVQAKPSEGGAGALVVLLAPRDMAKNRKQTQLVIPDKDEVPTGRRQQSPIERMAMLLAQG